MLQLMGQVTGVSIHAPVRGATTDSPQIHEILRVSIHAPVRGATIRQPLTLISA